MKIAILNAQVPFVYGGAEFLAESLKKQLTLKGHQAEIVSLPFKWYPNKQLESSIEMTKFVDIEESAGAKIDIAVALKFPLYYINHSKKKLWLLHQFRQVYDFYDSGDISTFSDAEGKRLRKSIIDQDNLHLSTFNNRYTISKNVSQRLLKYNNLSSEALYPPPPDTDILYTGEYEDYFFYPSRLDASKRQDLILHALAVTKSPVKVIFAGGSPSELETDKLIRLIEKYDLSHRVKLLGPISTEEKIKLYANCLGVLFSPIDEDLGYITMEAMICKKPVITCTDSGGALEFITDNVDGYIATPTPEHIAESMEKIWNDRSLAKSMGEQGHLNYNSKNINWNRITEVITNA